MKGSKLVILAGVLAFLQIFIAAEGRATRGYAVSDDSLSLEMVKEGARQIASVRSLLVQQNGHLIAEHYFEDMEAAEAINIKSASKSIISLLVGIAVDQGILEGVHQKIGPFFRDYFRSNPDSVKENIRLKDLLTMRAGLETTSFHNYGRWVVSDNWTEYVLEQPVVEEPGGDMVYSTGTSHLLSVILTKATGMSTRRFARKHLFDPMNIRVGGWDRDPQGYYFGGNNMALRPADMIKIGQMVLNGGLYQGRRIISEGWLDKSFQTYTRSNYNPYDYGFMWWKKPVGGFRVQFAWGYGGQYIFIIPRLDAVVVMTGNLSNATQSRSYKDPVFSLLREQLLPLLKNRIVKGGT